MAAILDANLKMIVFPMWDFGGLLVRYFWYEILPKSVEKPFVAICWGLNCRLTRLSPVLSTEVDLPGVASPRACPIASSESASELTIGRTRFNVCILSVAPVVGTQAPYMSPKSPMKPSSMASSGADLDHFGIKEISSPSGRWSSFSSPPVLNMRVQ